MKQTKASGIPRTPLTCVLLEVSPYRNYAGRHKPVASRPRQFQWGSDAPQEDLPTLEIHLRQSRGGRSRTQITRHNEGTGSSKIPASPNTASHRGGTANHICGNAQHRTNLRMVRSNPRFANRGGSQPASAGLESEDVNVANMPFRRRTRRLEGHENGDEQHDPARTATVSQAHRRSMRRQESSRLHSHLRRRHTHHAQPIARPLQRSQVQGRTA